MKIQLTKEFIDFLESEASKIDLGEGHEWYYIPYWYHRVEGDIFEEVSFEYLPERVQEFIKDMRNDTRK